MCFARRGLALLLHGLLVQLLANGAALIGGCNRLPFVTIVGMVCVLAGHMQTCERKQTSTPRLRSASCTYQETCLVDACA